MTATSTDTGAGPAERREHPRLMVALLATFGVWAALAGLALLVAPGLIPVLTPGAGSSEFIQHIAESRGASLLALAVVTLAMLRNRERTGPRAPLLSVLFLAALLAAFVDLAAQRGELTDPIRWAAVIADAAWAVGFGYLATIHSGDPAARQGPLDATPRWEQATVWTFVAFTMFTGIAWIVAPSAFTDAVAGVVGTEATYAGQARGVADVAFALLVWSMRHRAGSTAGRAALGAAVVANAALSIVGLVAQRSELATPSRWIVELLHVGWTVGFAALWLRARRARR
ncbi:MAG TPA: hypothetical protein VK631_16680 [Solirubrobacteraceae bacterium]|nr:hypothetical protein [Solirubrobacteraceae bacterium]